MTINSPNVSQEYSNVPNFLDIAPSFHDSQTISEQYSRPSDNSRCSLITHKSQDISMKEITAHCIKPDLGIESSTDATVLSSECGLSSTCQSCKMESFDKNDSNYYGLQHPIVSLDSKCPEKTISSESIKLSGIELDHEICPCEITPGTSTSQFCSRTHCSQIPHNSVQCSKDHMNQTPSDEDYKKEQRKERNKLSAQSYRQRLKDNIANQETILRKLQEENIMLKWKLKRLKIEKLKLIDNVKSVYNIQLTVPDDLDSG